MTRREAARLRDRLDRRERGWTMALATAMLSGLVLCAYAAMCLMPYYGSWRRENSLGTHPIGTLEAPFSLDIEIRYDAERPKNVHIVNLDTGRHLYGLEEAAQEPGESGILRLSGDFGEDAGNGEYALELTPGTNSVLSCQVSPKPSTRHITASFVPYRSSTGDLWLEVHAGYWSEARNGTTDVTVRLTGQNYSADVYAVRSELPELSARINVSRLLCDLGLDLDKGSSIEMSASAGYDAPDGSGASYANKRSSLDLDDWPAYDPDKAFDFSGSDTDAYLESVLPEPDVPGPEAGQNAQEKEEPEHE